MIVTTAGSLKNHRVTETIGPVSACITKSGRPDLAVIDDRGHAVAALADAARAVGADAVLDMRVVERGGDGASADSEILATGTAVRLSLALAGRDAGLEDT